MSSNESYEEDNAKTQHGHHNVQYTWVYKYFHEPETIDAQVPSEGPGCLMYCCKHCP
ncbi:hypothetical protein CROQUDRAFT_666537 [Cronartium quercuum f. sp. fusiforme G11]|uniref:Uncharacterized protein n=1 Tax=Cronartium quercuum f. sp. fusiforme G11 TaxID=708437 RepID=A0A9P6N589_9BASI|nr:hypothetical protein CROQUDRAFT_666537 [Cronartium quercuum f. sp. fusiforme G11]